VRQAQEQRLGERKEKGLAFHRLVTEPSLKPLDTAVGLGPSTSWSSGNLVGNGRKIRALAAHNPADQAGQGVQPTAQVPNRFNREQLSQRVTDCLKSFYCRSCGSPYRGVLV
jgi:hypothetical protein